MINSLLNGVYTILTNSQKILMPKKSHSILLNLLKINVSSRQLSTKKKHL